MTLNPCSPGLIFKRDRIIFSFCFTYRYNLIGICLARVALPRNFDSSFILLFESLFHGNRRDLINFLQFEYNKHYVIVYGIGRTLYAVVPRTTAITNKKTNLFLTLGREIRRLPLLW